MCNENIYTYVFVKQTNLITLLIYVCIFKYLICQAAKEKTNEVYIADICQNYFFCKIGVNFAAGSLSPNYCVFLLLGNHKEKVNIKSQYSRSDKILMSNCTVSVP